MGVFERLRELDDRVTLRGGHERQPRGQRASAYWRRLDDGARTVVIDMASRQEITTEPELALLLQDLLDQQLERLWRGVAWSVLGALSFVAGVIVLLGFVLDVSLSSMLLGLGGPVGVGFVMVAVIWRTDRARRENANVARAAGLLG